MKTKILTTGIPGVFRGLKFKSKAEIGQKGIFLELSHGRMVHLAPTKTPFFKKEDGVFVWGGR
jgi:hypothetical protein